MEMIAYWDYQVPEYTPNSAQNAWWAASKLNTYKYVYRAEFWLNEAGKKFAVLFTYRSHPLTGARYIERRTEAESFVAVNDPIVVALAEFPPVS